jgi:hypothetical protein
MENPNCELAWCESPHNNMRRIANHYRRLGAFDCGDTTVTVMARWAERLDGRPTVGAHLTIFTDAPGIQQATIDLTPREARIWAGQLEVFNGAPWLAARLREGADMLHEWEAEEFAGVPHRVADRPTTAPESYVFALRAAVSLSRATLESFEELPATTMAALDLARWIGEFRTCVRSLVQAVEALDTAGGLA